MSTASNVRTGKEVIEAILTADTPAKKAKATKLKNEFVARRVAEGKDARKVLAGLLSRVSRLSGGAAKTAPAPEATAKAKMAPKTTVKKSPDPGTTTKTKAAPKATAKAKTAKAK